MAEQVQANEREPGDALSMPDVDQELDDAYELGMEEDDDTWREEHFCVWSPLYKKICHFFTTSSFILLLLSHTHVGDVSTHLSKIGFLPESEVIGETLAVVQLYAPFAVCVILSVLQSTRLYTHKTHSYFVSFCTIGLQLSIGLACNLAQLKEAMERRKGREKRARQMVTGVEGVEHPDDEDDVADSEEGDDEDDEKDGEVEKDGAVIDGSSASDAEET